MKSTELQIPCEIYSRFSGYYRPVENWNKGKKKEFQDRKFHTIPESTNEK